ncbi:Mur ligase [Thermosipho melanesiensis]|uniref:Mur ligase, middle domain protein n=2 Tax=Thermosipho melanesiensis TaxID=46541 RepID=A6LKA4_THEM4|nr:UDP-N-acetylmuramoyl-tripeptide--D-alanyl-D-alanine ligase [Thermosipho melanesiensis]ABR30355.1 Mur ligase, middle domain protein [Thermosipho melanesiensis BI429]APT73521.1 Mur ligase [Thermosipho melanesiensis]OOC37471.1 Mur ligase [Thermosipho melanesiensis]OOC39676.1 Mur ligase [Thermosipho melanesiensis]OOC39704.1 Mur ligase [Thermosipho melanesiensis]
MVENIFLALLVTNFVLRSFYSLHMLQLEEYSEKKYFKWIFSHVKRYLINILLVLSLIFYFVNTYIALVFLVMSIYIDLRYFVLVKKKKPLVFTKRLRRLIYISYIFFGIALIWAVQTSSIFSESVLFMFVVFNSFFYFLTNAIMTPIEKLINEYYYKDAKRKIKRLNPEVVAITGSYGKTSTKFYLYHLISEYYKTLMTPGSYNTTMGITKVIREKLDKSHDVFIVELAENDNYGFEKLLDLVNPTISVITSIGIQHFEEFENESNILDNFKKYIKDSRSGKKFVVNFDDENIRKIIKNKDIISCGIENKEAQYRIVDLKLDKDGSNFVLETPNNQKFEFTTNVYGKENVLDLLLAIVTAFELKVPVEEIIERAKNIVKPKHRLEVIRDDTITVIDDTFNSNPKGFKMALEYLSLFGKRRKILITPGFVELGEKEDEEHYKLGKLISKYVDVVFLVDKKRTKKILEGLEDSNFTGEIYTVNSLDEVTEMLKTFLKSGDVVLFENDLPDNYT